MIYSALIELTGFWDLVLKLQLTIFAPENEAGASFRNLHDYSIRDERSDSLRTLEIGCGMVRAFLGEKVT